MTPSKTHQKQNKKNPQSSNKATHTQNNKKKKNKEQTTTIKKQTTTTTSNFARRNLNMVAGTVHAMLSAPLYWHFVLPPHSPHVTRYTQSYSREFEGGYTLFDIGLV